MSIKKDWGILLALAILTILVRIPSLEIPLDPDSGANSFLARQIINGDILYGTYHTGHHLPGIYYTYAFAFMLFGDNSISAKLLLFPFIFGSAVLLFMLGKLYFDYLTGVLASIFFVFTSAEFWLTGTSADMGHFANLPLTGCMFICIQLVTRNSANWKFIWVGILGAICVLYKVVFIAPLVVAGISIFALAKIDMHKSTSIKKLLARLSWLAIGLIIPLAISAGYFIYHDLGWRFWLVFSSGSSYVLKDKSQMIFSSLPAPFGFSIVWLSINNLILLILGLLGVYRFIIKAIKTQTIERLPKFALGLWFLFSLAFAGIRGGGLPNYCVQCIPPLALLGAAEISTRYQGWKVSSPVKAVGNSSLLITLVFFCFLWWNYALYSSYINYKLEHISFKQFLYNHTIFAERMLATQTLVDYIDLHTTSDDLVYLWSIDVEFYYYADRKPPVDVLWPFYVSAYGPPERIFNPKTKYIILDKPTAIERPQWLLDGLAQYYNFETTVAGKEIYRRH